MSKLGSTIDTSLRTASRADPGDSTTNPSTVPLSTKTLDVDSGNPHHSCNRIGTDPSIGLPTNHRELGPPVETFSLVNDPVSCVSPYFPPAILNASSDTAFSDTVFSDTPNLGPWPSGSGSNIRDEPTGPSQGVGPKNNEKSHKEQEPELSQRLIPSGARKTRPVSYEGDVVRLQQRCRENGADESVIAFLGKIFADEVSLEALTRPLTGAEVETKEFGIGIGKTYHAFLK